MTERASRHGRHGAFPEWLAMLIACSYLGTACEKEKPSAADVLVNREGEQGEQRFAPATPDEPAVLGELAETRHFSMKFTNVKQCTVAAPFRPRHGEMKLGVLVEITGKGDLEVPVNPFYASLETPDGTRYASTLAGCDPVLEPARLVQGQTASGWITFDVPVEPKQLTLTYAPNLIGAGVQSVHFKLPR